MPAERTRAERVPDAARPSCPPATLVDLVFSAVLVGSPCRVPHGVLRLGVGGGGVGGLLLGLVVAHVVAAFGLPGVVTLLGLAAAYFLFGGPLAVRDLIAGVIPTGAPSATSPCGGAGWKGLLTLLPPSTPRAPCSRCPSSSGAGRCGGHLLVARRRRPRVCRRGRAARRCSG